MKRKLLLLFVLLFIFVIFVAIKFFFASQKEKGGVIKILSSPTSTVFIDSAALGKTPYENKIKIGEHIIKLIPEKTATNTASWQGKILISQGTLAYIDRELGENELSSSGVIFTISKSPNKENKDGGELFVESEPDGSIIYLDNDEKGITPLVLSGISKGNHELSVYNPGFLRRTQKINIEEGYRLNAHFKLAIDPSFKKISEEDLVNATIAAALSTTPSPTSTAGTTTSGKPTITVRSTPTGWLRVRNDPNVNATEAAKINPGDVFEIISEQSGWYKIEYSKGKLGWVSGQYVDKK